MNSKASNWSKRKPKSSVDQVWYLLMWGMKQIDFLKCNMHGVVIGRILLMIWTKYQAWINRWMICLDKLKWKMNSHAFDVLFNLTSGFNTQCCGNRQNSWTFPTCVSPKFFQHKFINSACGLGLKPCYLPHTEPLRYNSSHNWVDVPLLFPGAHIEPAIWI